MKLKSEGTRVGTGHIKSKFSAERRFVFSSRTKGKEQETRENLGGYNSTQNTLFPFLKASWVGETNPIRMPKTQKQSNCIHLDSSGEWDGVQGVRV